MHSFKINLWIFLHTYKLLRNFMTLCSQRSSAVSNTGLCNPMHNVILSYFFTLTSSLINQVPCNIRIKVSAVMDQNCSAGENRSTFSSKRLRRHCRLVAIPVFEADRRSSQRVRQCLKTGRGRRRVRDSRAHHRTFY